MLETPHVIIGAAIATKIPNPYISIPLALASHFILDKIPHWNPHFFTETQKLGKPSKSSTTIALVDEVSALLIGLFIASQFLPDYGHVITILLACLASVLPDQVKLPYFFLGVRNGLVDRWTKFERTLQVEVGPFWGITAQVITVLAGIFWMLN